MLSHFYLTKHDQLKQIHSNRKLGRKHFQTRSGQTEAGQYVIAHKLETVTNKKPKEILMRILLVEDDLHLSETLAFQLKHHEFTVDTCDNGEDALFYIEENIHDLILLDRMLPKIDGVTLLKKCVRRETIPPLSC